MTDTQASSPYWVSRSINEQAFEEQKLVRLDEIEHPRGQRWCIKGGPTFAVQWFGENDQYFDQTQVSNILEAVADWRAKNPNHLN